MLSMVKYLLIMVVLYILADKYISQSLDRPVQIITDLAIYLLVFIMGTRIGSNDEVISRLGSVGAQAVVITALAFAGSIFMAFLTRSFIMLDRQGRSVSKIDRTHETAWSANKYDVVNAHRKETPDYESNGLQSIGISDRKEYEDNDIDAVEAAEGSPSSETSSLKSTGIICLLVVLGMAVGHFVVPEFITDIDGYQDSAGKLIDLLLCVLLGGVGYGLGREGDILKKFRTIGFRIFALPIAIMSGTAIMGFCYGVYSSMTIRESMAIFMGMGWYGMAPALIMNAGYNTAAAISFLHNILREVLSMLLIPVVASKIGYFEAASLPGATGMDCCLPAVRKYTNNEVTVMSLVSGIICSVMVPLLVPLIIG